MNLFVLAQMIPYDGGSDAPKAPVHRPMNFSDFQNGMRQWNDGATDNTLRNGLLVVVVLVLLVGLLMHMRQRLKRRPEVDSEASLGRELSRVVPFPFGSRILLWWVARSNGVHMATLLISAQAFDSSVAAWGQHHTFGMARAWGAGRLAQLKQVLFATS